MGREAQHQSNITDRLDKLDRCWWTKIHNAGRGRRGIPDLLICYRGIFLAVEMKTDDRRSQLRNDQAAEIQALQKAGAIAIVARRWDDILPWIQRIDRDVTNTGLGYTTGERVGHRAPRITPVVHHLDEQHA